MSDAKPYTTEEISYFWAGNDGHTSVGATRLDRLMVTVRALDAANARVAELEADLSHVAANRGELVVSLADTVAERDEWKAQAAKLREALHSAGRHYTDGPSCWCHHPNLVPVRGHDDACRHARALLAKLEGR